MAVTKGHGNPRWGKDETILALDLYLQMGGKAPDKSNERVIDLSNLLRSNPFHSKDKRKSSFRNPDGVAFKVQNLRAVHTKTGLTNVSKMDETVWNEYGDRPEEVAKLAAEIKKAMQELPEEEAQAQTNEDDSGFEEGRLLLRLHRYRERNPSIKNALIAKRRQEGRLHCEICGSSPRFDTGPMALGEFDAHHIQPLSECAANQKVTKLEDVALLCANCHRLTHRLFTKEKSWFTIQTVRKWLGYA